MAVERQYTKGIARLKLNNGTSPSGVVQTVNQSMPTLSESYSASTDDTKLMAIIEALSPCLTKSVYAVEFVATYTLVD